MGKTAGVITINLNAGTAQFIQDMDRAGAKVRDFGKQANSTGLSARYAFLGIKDAFEGRTTFAIAEAANQLIRLQGSALLLGGTVAGVAAFGVAIYKINEYLKEMAELPIAGKFREIGGSLRLTNDELSVTNDRLQNEISKLEGRRQNTLALALDEARAAADKLAESLDKDIQKLDKFLRDNQAGAMGRLLSGLTGGVIGESSDKGLREEIGGKTGYGGFVRQIADIEDAGNRAISSAKTQAEAAAARAKLDTDLGAKYRDIIGELEKQRRAISDDAKSHPTGRNAISGAPEMTTDKTGSVVTILEKYDAAISAFSEMKRFVPLQSAVTSNTVTRDQLKTDSENAKALKPFEDRVAKLKSDISAASLKLDAAGQGEAAKVLAKANGDAVIAIEEVNKAMAEHHRALTTDQQDQIRGLEVRLAKTNADEQWAAKLAQTTQQIRDQVEGQKMLTAAIGQGYEAVKKANVENELMSRVGPDAYNNPAKLGDIAGLRSQLGGEYDAKHSTQVTEQADALRDQITLETRVAQVQMQGAEAVRLATLQVTLAKLQEKGATQELLDLTVRRSELERDSALGRELSSITQKVEATKRLSAAQIEGAEAVRRAALANTIAELQNKPGGATNAQIDAARAESESQHELKISEAVSRRVNIYSEHLADLEAEAQYLKGITVTEANRLDIIRAGRDIENERLHVLSQQALSLGTARDGVRAFFLEMQADGKKAAQTVYDAFNQSLEGISSNAAKFMSGQKTAWKSMFQGIAEGVFKDQVETQLRQGVRDIAKHFPGLANGPLGGLLAGKPDGSSSDRALWVRMSGPALATPGAAGSPGGDFPGHGSIFGGSQGGLIFNLVSPSAAYRSTAPSASPNRSSSPESRGDGRPNVYFGDIIVNGGEPESNRRGVLSAIQQAMAQAVATSVQVGHDQTRRMPGSRA